MDQGMKGIGLFLTGWILVLATYYLGPLDTGLWVPLVVTGVEIIGLSLMLIGIRQISDQHKNYRVAQTIAVLALVASLGIGILEVLSLGGITYWMAIVAVFLAVAGDLLFMILSGLIFLGLSARVRINGNESEANRVGYLWAIFLTFAILYLLIQVVAVLLINEGLAALTYIVPVAGLPLLVVGALLIVRIYRMHAIQVQEIN
jgi:hypothetical protein